jgi:predicted O-methyltransferase YrrM
VESAITRMFAQAEKDHEVELHAFESMTAQERADAAAEIYMPISAEGGRLLYNLIRATRPATVVEFGTSFGISTLYLAAAVRDNGTGQVITTELSTSKITTARRTFEEAGLADLITVREGDARETLTGVKADFVLLDGWKELYLPVLHLLEPALAPGTLVIADDTALPSVHPYLAHVRDPANGYQSINFPIEDGMEISCRL